VADLKVIYFKVVSWDSYEFGYFRKLKSSHYWPLKYQVAYF